jgi:hypothetical protein
MEIYTRQSKELKAVEVYSTVMVVALKNMVRCEQDEPYLSHLVFIVF